MQGENKMNISGIRPIGGYQTINNYAAVNKAADQERVYLAPLEEQDLTQVKKEDSDIARFSKARANQTFGAYDFANQYKPEDSFEIRAGREARLADVNQAISDMQKDEVLHQYQTFLGERRATATEAAAPQIRGGEDFTF